MVKYDIHGFKVFSDNLNNGEWDDVISNTKRGKNIPPHLKWDKVEGAASYVIMMIDKEDDWLHWYADDENQSQYIGPYPPEGIHLYTIYVVAMRKNVKFRDYNFDGEGNSFEKIAIILDGSENNIISIGSICGTYAYKD